MRKNTIIVLLLMLVIGTSCSEDWLDTKPSTSTDTEGAISTLFDAQVALNGVYSNLQDEEYYGADMFAWGDLRADDIRSTSRSKRNVNAFRYSYTTDANPSGLWSQPLKALKLTNNILLQIDNLKLQDGETEDKKASIKGQALALRALIHFDLTRLYGYPYAKDNGESLGAPIIKSKVDFTYKAKRSTVKECYEAIIEDLKMVVDNNMISSAVNNGFINLHAAQALLSRVYLYKGDDANALKYAEMVIDSEMYSFVGRKNYATSWSKEFSTESIFSIVNTTTDNADREAIGYLWDPEGYAAMGLDVEYMQLVFANEKDIRNSIIDSIDLDKAEDSEEIVGYLKKFPGIGDAGTRVNNVPLIRLPEVYLNAAEAALTVDKAKAVKYLNTLIENRYDVKDSLDVTTITKDIVLMERRKELVGEGQRFYDILRNGGTIDRTSDFLWGAPESVNWDHYQVVLPIPRAELNTNKEINQNPEYGE
ncbi:MAG: RagB/SusD family nutrient uptake outer membrane protein [Bacteroidales bacterium]